MSNMNSALMMRDVILEKELKTKTKEELLILKKEAEKREKNRIANIDWDDCFISSSIDRTTISIINSLLDTRIKRDFTNFTLKIDDFTITILEESKQHYHIINQLIKLDVDYYGCCYGKVTGKGARKYVDELEDLNKQVRNYIRVNKYE